MEIRRSYDRLISTLGFPILVRCHLYIESGPWILSLFTRYCWFISQRQTSVTICHFCSPVYCQDRRHITQTVHELIIQIYKTNICISYMTKRWIWSCHNFAHVMTAQLSWHVHIRDMIGLLESKLQQSGCSLNFSYEFLNLLWNWPELSDGWRWITTC